MTKQDHDSGHMRLGVLRVLAHESCIHANKDCKKYNHARYYAAEAEDLQWCRAAHALDTTQLHLVALARAVEGTAPNGRHARTVCIHRRAMLPECTDRKDGLRSCRIVKGVVSETQPGHRPDAVKKPLRDAARDATLVVPRTCLRQIERGESG